MVGGQPKPDTAVSSSPFSSLSIPNPHRPSPPFLPCRRCRALLSSLPPRRRRELLLFPCLPPLQKVPTPCPLLQGALLPPYLPAASLKTAHSPASPPPLAHLWSLLGPSRRIRSPKSSRMHILWRSGSAQARHAIGQATLSGRRRRLGHGRRVHRIRSGGQRQLQGNSCLS
jgi:hypothetical protein